MIGVVNGVRGSGAQNDCSAQSAGPTSLRQTALMVPEDLPCARRMTQRNRPATKSYSNFEIGGTVTRSGVVLLLAIYPPMSQFQRSNASCVKSVRERAGKRKASGTQQRGL